MPLRVSQLKGKERTISVNVEGEEEPIRLTYNPGELTLEISDKIKESLEGGFEGDVAGIVLAPILVDWDLLRDDGSPLPCNADEIRRLPLQVLGLLMVGVAQDLRPDPLKSVTSGDTSNSTDERDGSRTGSFFSEQPIAVDAAPGNS